MICSQRAAAARYIRGGLIHLPALPGACINFPCHFKCALLCDPREELTSQKEPPGGEGGFEVFKLLFSQEVGAELAVVQGHCGSLLLTMCIVTGVRTGRVPPRSWEVTWQIPGCDYSPCDGEWGHGVR